MAGFLLELQLYLGDGEITLSIYIKARENGYILRPLFPEDATENISDALNRDDIRKNLNINAPKLNLETLRKFLSIFDFETRHIIGIFSEQDKCVALYTLDVNAMHKSAILTSAVLDESAQGAGVLLKTINSFLDFYFSQVGLKKIICRIDRDNKRILQNMLFQMQNHEHYKKRFFYEGTQWQEFSRADGTRMDVLTFSAYADDYQPLFVQKIW